MSNVNDYLKGLNSCYCFVVSLLTFGLNPLFINYNFT